MVAYPLLLRHLAKQPRESKSHAETGTPNHPLLMARSPRTGERGGHRPVPMPPDVNPNPPMRPPTVNRPGNQFTDISSPPVAIKISTTSSENLPPPASVLSPSNSRDGTATSERPSSTSFPGTSHSGTQIESTGSSPVLPSHSSMTTTSSTSASSDATLSDIASATTNGIDKGALTKSSPNHNSLTMGILGGVLGSLLFLVAFFFSKHFWQRYKRRLEGLNNASATRQTTGLEGAPPYTASAPCVKEAERPVGHEVDPSSATPLRELHEDELMVVRRNMPSFLPNTVIYDEQTRHLYLPVQSNASIRSTQATLGSVNVQHPDRDLFTVRNYYAYMRISNTEERFLTRRQLTLAVTLRRVLL